MRRAGHSPGAEAGECRDGQGGKEYPNAGGLRRGWGETVGKPSEIGDCRWHGRTGIDSPGLSGRSNFLAKALERGGKSPPIGRQINLKIKGIREWHAKVI
jgi:hypothetical protein